MVALLYNINEIGGVAACLDIVCGISPLLVIVLTQSPEPNAPTTTLLTQGSMRYSSILAVENEALSLGIITQTKGLEASLEKVTVILLSNTR